MTPEEVDETMSLLKEAVAIFHTIYENKQIVGNLHDGDKLFLELKATELLHILGITRNQVLNNQELCDVLKIKSSYISSYDILCRIINDFESNKDIIQLHDNNINISKIQFGDNIKTQLLPFHKIRSKSLSFIKSGPVTHPKLISKIVPGQKLAANSNSNIAMISQTDLSKNYKWVYIGGVNNDRRVYTETLIVDRAGNQKQKFTNQVAAMLVSTENSNGGINVFSDEQQFSLFKQANDEFGGEGGMDFSSLYDYFNYTNGRKK